MLNYQVKIGLVTLRRNLTDRPKGAIFNWYSAEQRGKSSVEYIRKNFENENVSFVDCTGLGIGDLVFDNASARDAIERFQQEKVDAVVIINCNFGNEEAAGDIAKALNKPVLLWAPLDDEYYEEGMRATDAQCGLFGISRQLQRLHVPFSNIPSCRVESEEFKEGFERFLKVSCMVKNFSGMRIGQVGTRPMPFYSVICNEGELLEKFGIRIIPINFAIIQQKMAAAPQLYPQEIAEYEEYLNKNYEMDDLTPKFIKPIATLAATYRHLFEEYELDVLSAECWTATPLMFDGMAPCAVIAVLNELGYMISCESDIHCAMTMALLKCATFGKKMPIFGEFTVRHPENKNGELLWHCGPFSAGMKAEGARARLVNQRVWMRAKNGTYTAARLDQESGKYMILPLRCQTMEGPETHGSYIWAEFENLKKVEDRLMQGPYIHHFVEIEGDVRAEIEEFCRFCPNLNFDRLD